VRKAGSTIHPTEPYTPNQNRAESAIRELKRIYRMAMTKSNAPQVLWDHCLELQAEIRSHTALDMLPLQGLVILLIFLTFVSLSGTRMYGIYTQSTQWIVSISDVT
jgi:hypothetical protein